MVVWVTVVLLQGRHHGYFDCFVMRILISRYIPKLKECGVKQCNTSANVNGADSVAPNLADLEGLYFIFFVRTSIPIHYF